MNQLKAVFASILVTGLIAAVMVVIGGSALFSKPAVAVSAASNVSAVSNSTSNSAETQQLRDLVNQYQAREQQLRQQIDDANKQLDEKDQQLSQLNQQLSEANQQVDQTTQQIGQYQNLLQALAQRGIIQITDDGRIRLPSR
jgi:peptidoglycan hydrolase CwlO-like protein